MSRMSAAYARGIVRLRWAVVAVWVAAGAASMLFLPAVGQGGGDLS